MPRFEHGSMHEKHASSSSSLRQRCGGPPAGWYPDPRPAGLLRRLDIARVLAETCCRLSLATRLTRSHSPAGFHVDLERIGIYLRVFGLLKINYEEGSGTRCQA